MQKMKMSDQDNLIQSKLEQFEKIDSIFPSDDWNRSFYKKLNEKSKTNNIAINIKVGFAIILLIVNLGFVIGSIFSKEVIVSEKHNDLELISKELLINPTSINN